MCLVVLFTKHLRYMHARKCTVWKAVFSSVSPLLTTSLQVLLSLLCLSSVLERQRSDFVTGALSRILLDNHILALRWPFSRILVLCMNHQAQTSEPPATNKMKWMEHSVSLTWALSFTWTVNTQSLLIHTYPLQTHNHQQGNPIEIMLLSFFKIISIGPRNGSQTRSTSEPYGELCRRYWSGPFLQTFIGSALLRLTKRFCWEPEQKLTATLAHLYSDLTQQLR